MIIKIINSDISRHKYIFFKIIFKKSTMVIQIHIKVIYTNAKLKKTRDKVINIKAINIKATNIKSRKIN